MSNYSDPITATGSLITLDAPSGGIFDSLSVPITPTQDLHGYANPWPGGGGKNILPDISRNSSGYNVSVSFVGNTATLTGLANSSGGRNVFRSAYFSLAAGTYYFKRFNEPTVKPSVYLQNGTSIVSADANGMFTLSADSTQMNIGLNVTSGTEYNYTGTFLVSRENVSEYSPYSNICPITGLTGLSVYVGPTQDPDDAAEYAVTFPEVLAGSVDPVTGEIKQRPVYNSYNGETLTGPWMSSMDAYAAGTTPTNGAQVVDLGGALSTESITPVSIPMREGSNYIWVDTSAAITLIYRLLQVDRQTGATSIGRLAQNLLIANQFGAYSKVILNVTEELYYEAGNDTGRTLELTCPFGTQAMANNILAMLEGFQYQPYTAERAILDPAAELGDGLTVNGVYGGIFRLSIKSGAVYNADVSAPADEEIDHEYAFVPNSERKIERKIANISSELSVQAGEIAAKVDREGGDPSSVSWTMDADVFKVAVDGSDVLTVDENGLTVNGDGNFTGNVQAKNIRYGGSNGTFSGGGISGGSIGTSKFTSGINVSLGNADYSADVFSGAVTASWTKATNILVQAGGMLNVVGSAKIKYGNSYASWQSKVVKDSGGSNITIHYLGF